MTGLTVAHLVGTTGRTGVETHLRVLFEGLRAEGVTPYLVCPGPGPLVDDLTARGFVVRLAAPRSRAGGLELVRTAGAARGADLLHAHGPRAMWWSGVLRQLGIIRPAVATLHEFARAGAATKGPRALIDRAERWTLGAHDRLIAVSDDLCARVVAATGIARSRIDVIPNSCPLMLAPPPAQEPAAEPRYALAASRLNREKGLDVMVEALGLLAAEGLRIPVRVLGDGSEREPLERLARARGVAGGIQFLGWSDAVAAAMAKAAMFLSPARDEPFGISVLEAMALGVPIVATRVGGPVDLLRGVDEPALVPAEDPRAFAEAMRAAWSKDEAWRRAQGLRLQERAYHAFSVAAMARGTVGTYARVLGRAVESAALGAGGRP